MQPSWRKIGHWAHALIGDKGTLACSLFSLLSSHHEVNRPPLPSVPTMIYGLATSIWLSNQGLKPLELGDKINLSSFHIFIPGICHSEETLTSTGRVARMCSPATLQLWTEAVSAGTPPVFLHHYYC